MFLQFFPVTHVNSLGMLTKKVPTKKMLPGFIRFFLMLLKPVSLMSRDITCELCMHDFKEVKNRTQGTCY